MPDSPAPITPSPLDAHLGFWMRFVSNHVSGRFQQMLEAKGVSVTEWVALRTLWTQPETRHMELIQALGMTKGAASKIVSRLEEKGLAARHYKDGNLREQYLVLTAAGMKLVPELAELADANDDHFFGHLDAQDRRILMGLMKALVQHHRFQTIPVS